ncbi:LexA family transcriptional regulator [Mycetohabitans sp. B8]|uniref:LexA family protein n=1 Tax=Mycetohabitans sp. B8 TaxID=2841845 RepID=UPI001F3AC79C|nr:XRE family transcriptional regulator [Mycetohabitans sp. B8]
MITTNLCNIADMTNIHIGTRVKELRELAQMSQSQLARAVGVTPQAVQKWEAETAAPRPSKLKSIANALSASVNELVRGTELEELPVPFPQKEASGSKVLPLRSTTGGAPRVESGYIPLISWVQAADWGQNMGYTKPENVQEWLRCPFDHGPAAFVLEVTGESNFNPAGPKSYAPGELIYVDPARKPTNRSMVVVRMDGEERAQLKQLLMDESGTKLLKSLNPSWPAPITPIPDGATIVGVVIGKWVSE